MSGPLSAVEKLLAVILGLAIGGLAMVAVMAALLWVIVRV